MTTHSSILAWEIPWTEEPGRLQSTGSQRVKRDWVTEHENRRTYEKLTCSLKRLSLPTLSPAPIPSVLQALVIDILPLLTNYLVILVMAHGHLITLIAYFVNFISREPGNYICGIVIFSSTLGQFIILHSFLRPSSYLLTVMSLLFLASFSVFTDQFGLPTFPGTHPSLLREEYVSVLYRLFCTYWSIHNALPTSGESDIPARQTGVTLGGDTRVTSVWDITAQILIEVTSVTLLQLIYYLSLIKRTKN